MWQQKHQYIERHTRSVRTEHLLGDGIVRSLYAQALEDAPWLCRVASSAWTSNLLAFIGYDNRFGARAAGTLRFASECGIDLSECVEPLHRLDTPRKIFERQIRYWECRPMPDDPRTIVCPADARVLVGSLDDGSPFFVKGKFFDYEELLGVDQPRWLRMFEGADWAIFRLTPEKYHYTHVPADGKVVAIYDIDGRYHSCNPGAVVSLIAPHSKNRRSVTILDTDVSGGSRVGLIAMIEVVALMVGRITQSYSSDRYHTPRAIYPNMRLKRGQPKSVFLPGSSTVILLFERGRMRFSEDLVANLRRPGVESRFSLGFGQRLVETEVAVRSLLAQPQDKSGAA